MTVEITCTVRGNPPSVPFEKTAKDILKSGYNLSLVLCGDALSRRINREYSEAPRSLTPRYQSGVLRSQSALLRQGFAGFSSLPSSRQAAKYAAKEKKKDYPANVLSFPLSKHEGEIFLNVRKAEREAKVAGISARARIALLFIHGCLHLRGFRHGTAMEKLERNTLKKFGFHPVT
ncbi:MAG: rRNA maturation RNase YbeY [Patescibacteria group bacterium]